MNKFKTVNEYISSFPKKTQITLRKLDSIIRKNAPHAISKISYGMPTYQVVGSFFVGWIMSFAVFKKHIGVFISPSFKNKPKEMKKYQATKSSHHFKLDKPFPFAVISKTVKAIVKTKNTEFKKDYNDK